MLSGERSFFSSVRNISLLLLFFYKDNLRYKPLWLKTLNLKKIEKRRPACFSGTMNAFSLASFNSTYTPLMFETLSSSTSENLLFAETNSGSDGFIILARMGYAGHRPESMIEYEVNLHFLNFCLYLVFVGLATGSFQMVNLYWKKFCFSLRPWREATCSMLLNVRSPTLYVVCYELCTPESDICGEVAVSRNK